MARKKRFTGEDGREYIAKEKKPFYKKWWFIVLVVIIIVSAFSDGDEETADIADKDDMEQVEEIGTTEEAKVNETEVEPVEEEAVEEEPETEPEPESEVSREFRNAQETAEQYLVYTSFSKSGLYDQLLFEGYPEDAAQYAIDRMDEGVNWDIQALEKAKEYLEYSSFSDQGLYDQLLFEGFTEEQAQYAIDNLE